MSAKSGQPKLADIVKRNDAEILDQWMRAQLAATDRRNTLIRETELRSQSAEFISLLSAALSASASLSNPNWDPVRHLLADISRSRTEQGFTPSEIANFVFSLKKPLFESIATELATNTTALFEEILAASEMLDQLALHTTEVFQKTREAVISRQQQDMLELSTPVIKLWDGVLALPMIGTLDSGRTQVVMESLLERIVETGAEIAILDITGVPTVDTLVAQHLLKTVTAARLMGADCIISGIRPQIAQTIVHLGVDLKNVTTKASLADAFALAMRRKGLQVVSQNSKS